MDTRFDRFTTSLTRRGVLAAAVLALAPRLAAAGRNPLVRCTDCGRACVLRSRRCKVVNGAYRRIYKYYDCFVLRNGHWECNIDVPPCFTHYETCHAV